MSARRITVLIAVLSLAFQAAAQTASDRQLLSDRDFSGRIIVETPPAGANAPERVLYHIYRQLTGRDFYRPASYMFFRQAVKANGLPSALLAMPDRILRDSKIGTADVRIDAAHPYVEEGPEAYVPWRAAGR